jgi:hypothetical protein
MVTWWRRWFSVPGPIDDGRHGSVELGPDDLGGPRSGWWVYGRLVVTLTAIVALAVALPRHFHRDGPVDVLVALAAIVSYAFVGCMVQPRPALENLGPNGGLGDDPMRASDDWNRLLVVLKLLLAPGWLIGGAFLELWRYHAGRPELDR